MARTATEGPYRRSVHLWNVKFQCLCVARTTAQCIRIEDVSAYERLKMGCLCVVRTTTECLYRRSVCLWKVKNAKFVCG